jgi:hypothetical protein
MSSDKKHVTQEVYHTDDDKSLKTARMDSNTWRRMIFSHRQNIKEQNGNVIFYGKVIDQTGKGVHGVVINAESSLYVESLSEQIAYKGRKTARKVISVSTNRDGNFEISGYRASDLHFLSVSKSGYASTKKLPAGFIFGSAYSSNHKAYPSNPVIFNIWKKSDNVGRVISQRKRFYVRGDGSPNIINMEAGTITTYEADGDFCISVNSAYDGGMRRDYPWSIDVQAINGGVILSEDAYLYLAPEHGYGASLKLQFPDAKGSWTNDTKIKLYVKSRHGKRFSAVTAAIITGFNDNEVACDLSWVMNLDGNRTLEPVE